MPERCVSVADEMRYIRIRMVYFGDIGGSGGADRARLRIPSRVSGELLDELGKRGKGVEETGWHG